jgi:colanic acid/amylovoran biosynthesis protein
MDNDDHPTFMFAGNGCYANKGCEAIVRGTTNILEQSFSNPRFISVYFAQPGCHDREDEIDNRISHILLSTGDRFSRYWFGYQIRKAINPHSYQYYPFRNLRKYLNKVKAVLMLGGDNYALDYGLPDSYFNLNRYIELHQKPVILWGVSVGPFSKNPEYEKFAVKELKKVTRIYARETETLKYLKSIGIEENVRLVADPAYWLEPKPAVLKPEIEQAIRNGCVGLNLSPLIFRQSQGIVSNWIERAQEIVKDLLEKLDYSILLLPHVITHDNNILRDDFLFLAKVYHNIAPQKNGKLFILDNHYDAAETKWIISRLVTFVGARTHSTIAGISSCVPTISIGYSIKALGLNKDVYGSSEWLIKRDELSTDALSQKLASILSHRDELTAHLAGIVPEMKSRALSASKDLLQLSL